MNLNLSFDDYIRPRARMPHDKDPRNLAPSMKDALRNVIGAGDLIQGLTTKPLIANGGKRLIVTSSSNSNGLMEAGAQRFPRSTSAPNKTVHEKRSR